MKASKWFIGLAFLAIGLFSCSKDKDAAPSLPVNLESTPGAVAACDNNSGGVYKGVLVGSSGYFKLSLENGTDTNSCRIVFDGKTAYLTTTALANWTPGQPIDNAVFAGTLNGEPISLTMSCDAYGANISVSVEYPNHTIGVTVFKETSSTLVKCYEGTYTASGSSEIGVFNLAVYGTEAFGFQKDSHGSGSFTGTVSGNKLTIEGQSITIDDNGISGTATAGDGTVLTITGKRSM